MLRRDVWLCWTLSFVVQRNIDLSRLSVTFRQHFAQEPKRVCCCRVIHAYDTSALSGGEYPVENRLQGA